MQQRVVFGERGCPSWAAVGEHLQQQGFPIQMRMIDGQLAFPDEMPADAWNEVRVGILGGMITARREQDGVTLVTWGNADEQLRQAWNALTAAFAELSGGQMTV
jgi:hypothetical protein